MWIGVLMRFADNLLLVIRCLLLLLFNIFLYIRLLLFSFLKLFGFAQAKLSEKGKTSSTCLCSTFYTAAHGHITMSNQFSLLRFSSSFLIIIFLFF